MNEIDDKVAAAEARTDTKFAQLIGRMDVMRTEMDVFRAELIGRMNAIHTELVGRIDAIHTELVGRIGAIHTRLDGMDRRLDAVERDAAGMKFWVIGTGIAVVGLVIGIMAYGDQLFGLGISTSDIADAAARRAVETYIDQTRAQQ